MTKENMTKREVGWALKRLRESWGFTQDEMAAKIKISEAAYHLAEKNGVMGRVIRMKLENFLEANQ